MSWPWHTSSYIMYVTEGGMEGLWVCITETKKMREKDREGNDEGVDS